VCHPTLLIQTAIAAAIPLPAEKEGIRFLSVHGGCRNQKGSSKRNFTVKKYFVDFLVEKREIEKDSFQLSVECMDPNANFFGFFGLSRNQD